MSHFRSILDSYPTLFRRNTDEFSDHHHRTDNHQEHDGFSDQENVNNDDPVPVIDLQCIDQEKLREACRDWGIFRLVNHGIPLTLLEEVNEYAAQVFGLGFESKQALFSSMPTTALSYFWGTPALTPAGVALHKDKDKDKAKAKGGDCGGDVRAVLDFDWVEGLNVPLSQLPHLQLDQHSLLHSFRVLLDEYGKHQTRIAKSIFDAMTENLNLCSSLKEKERYLSPSTGLLRVYRYPACGLTDQQQVWGMGVHTDSSVMTILNQDEVGGLQLLHDKGNVWIDVKPIPNTLLVHLGDMMQAMSDDKYKSVKHRVKVHTQKERISLGYFVFPEQDFLIRSSTYKPFTYSDFRAQVQLDIKTLGFKVGLSRFRTKDDKMSL